MTTDLQSINISELAQSMRAAGLRSLNQLEAQLIRELHKRSYFEFFKYFWPELEPAAPYIQAKHTEVLCNSMQAVFEGKLPKLLIEIGPGYGKSLTCAVAITPWIWGCRDASYRMGFSTYADELTTRDSGKARDLITSIRYQELYGHVYKLTQMRDNLLRNDKGGYRVSLSVNGKATGFRFNMWIGDDLLNMSSIVSEAKREPFKLHLKAIATRGQIGKPYYRVIIGQRLHEDDPGGYAREKGYAVLCLPTEFDPSRKCKVFDKDGNLFFEDWRTERGELLFPAGFTAEMVAEAKYELTTNYPAQHQQLPVPAEGGLLKPDYVQLYEPHERPEIGFYFMSIDTAQGTEKNNDTTAIVVFGVSRKGIVLVDGWTGREAANFVLDRLLGTAVNNYAGLGKRYRPTSTVIEQKDWGKAMLSLLQSNKRWAWPLVPYTPVVGKDERAHMALPFFFQQKVWMPKGHPLTEAALAQLAVFPRSKVRDLADAIIQAVIYAQENYTFENIGASIEYESAPRLSATKARSIYTNDRFGSEFDDNDELDDDTFDD